MQDQIYVGEWVNVKSETREEIRRMFGVPKSSSTQVETDSFGKAKVQSDGCTHSDLQSITPHKMMDYLEASYTSDDNIHTLFKKVVDKVEGKIETPSEATTIATATLTDEVMPLTVPIERDPNKCEFCSYTNANKRAVSMHKIGKHRNR